MGGIEWLPTSKSQGTTVEDHSVITQLLVIPKESPRQKKFRERGKRREARQNSPSPAAQSLRRAIRWQEEIETTGINRAQIARREGLSRARVTQVMSLLALPDDVKAKLLADDDAVKGWSIRRVLGMTS